MKALGILLTILFINYTTRIEMTNKPIDNTPSYKLMKVKKKPTFSKKESKEILKSLNKHKKENNTKQKII